MTSDLTLLSKHTQRCIHSYINFDTHPGTNAVYSRAGYATSCICICQKASLCYIEQSVEKALRVAAFICVYEVLCYYLHMLPAEHVWACVGLFQGLYMYLHATVPVCIKGLVCIFMHWGQGMYLHVSTCQQLGMYLHVLAHIKCWACLYASACVMICVC